MSLISLTGTNNKIFFKSQRFGPRGSDNSELNTIEKNQNRPVWEKLLILFKDRGMMNEARQIHGELHRLTWPSLSHCSQLKAFWEEEVAIYSEKLGEKISFQRRELIQWLMNDHLIDLHSLELVGSSVLLFCGLEYFLKLAAQVLDLQVEQLKELLGYEDLIILKKELEHANDFDIRVKVQVGQQQYLQRIVKSITAFFTTKLILAPSVIKKAMSCFENSSAPLQQAFLLEQMIARFFVKEIPIYDGGNDYHLYKLGDMDFICYESLARRARFTKHSLVLPMAPFFLNGCDLVVRPYSNQKLSNGVIFLDILTHFVRPCDLDRLEPTDWLRSISHLTRGAHVSGESLAAMIKKFQRSTQPLGKQISYSLQHLPKEKLSMAAFYWNAFYTLLNCDQLPIKQQNSLLDCFSQHLPRSIGETSIGILLYAVKQQHLGLPLCHFILSLLARCHRRFTLVGHQALIQGVNRQFTCYLLEDTIGRNGLAILQQDNKAKEYLSSLLQQMLVDGVLDIPQDHEGYFYSFIDKCRDPKINSLLWLSLKRDHTNELILSSAWVWRADTKVKERYLFKLGHRLRFSEKELIELCNQPTYLSFLEGMYQSKKITEALILKSLCSKDDGSDQREEIKQFLAFFIKISKGNFTSKKDATHFLEAITKQNDGMLTSSLFKNKPLCQQLKFHSLFFSLLYSYCYQTEIELKEKVRLWTDYGSHWKKEADGANYYEMTIALLSSSESLPHFFCSIMKKLVAEEIPLAWKKKVSQLLGHFLMDYPEYEKIFSKKSLLQEDKHALDLHQIERLLKREDWNQAQQLALRYLEDPKMAQDKQFQNFVSLILAHFLRNPSNFHLTKACAIIKKPRFIKYQHEKGLKWIISLLETYCRFFQLNYEEFKTSSLRLIIDIINISLPKLAQGSQPLIARFARAYLIFLQNFYSKDSSLQQVQKATIKTYLPSLLASLWHEKSIPESLELLKAAHLFQLPFHLASETTLLLNQMFLEYLQQGYQDETFRKIILYYAKILNVNCLEKAASYFYELQDKDHLAKLFCTASPTTLEWLASLEKGLFSVQWLVGVSNKDDILKLFEATKSFSHPKWKAFWKNEAIIRADKEEFDLFLGYYFLFPKEWGAKELAQCFLALQARNCLTEEEVKFLLHVIKSRLLSLDDPLSALLPHVHPLVTWSSMSECLDLATLYLNSASFAPFLAKIISSKRCSVIQLMQWLEQAALPDIFQVRENLTLEHRLTLFQTLVQTLVRKWEVKWSHIKSWRLILSFKQHCLQQLNDLAKECIQEDISLGEIFLESSESSCLKEATLYFVEMAHRVHVNKEGISQLDVIVFKMLKKLRQNKHSGGSKLTFIHQLLRVQDQPSPELILQSILILSTEVTRDHYFAIMRLFVNLNQNKNLFNDAFLRLFQEQKEAIAKIIQRCTLTSSPLVESSLLNLLMVCQPLLNEQFNPCLRKLISKRLKQSILHLDSQYIQVSLKLFFEYMHCFQHDLHPFSQAVEAALQAYIKLLLHERDVEKSSVSPEFTFEALLERAHLILHAQWAKKPRRENEDICMCILKLCHRLVEAFSKNPICLNNESYIKKIYALFNTNFRFLYPKASEEHRLDLLTKWYLIEVAYADTLRGSGAKNLVSQFSVNSISEICFFEFLESSWVVFLLSKQAQQPLKEPPLRWSCLPPVSKGNVVSKACRLLMKIPTMPSLWCIYDLLAKYHKDLSANQLVTIYEEVFGCLMQCSLDGSHRNNLWLKFYDLTRQSQRLPVACLKAYLDVACSIFYLNERKSTDYTIMLKRYFIVFDRESIAARMQDQRVIIQQMAKVLFRESKRWEKEFQSFLHYLEVLILIIELNSQLRQAFPASDPANEGLNFADIYGLIQNLDASFASAEQRAKLKDLQESCLLNAHSLIFPSKRLLDQLFCIPLPSIEKMPVYFSSKWNPALLNLEKKQLLIEKLQQLKEDNLEKFIDDPIDWSQPWFSSYHILHLACWYESTRTMEWLIKHYPCLITDKSYGHSFLEVFCAKGLIDDLRKYFDVFKSHSNLSDFANGLGAAIHFQSEENALLLLDLYQVHFEHNRLVDLISQLLPNGLPLPHFALALGKYSYFLRLMQFKVDPNLADIKGNTLLNCLVSYTVLDQLGSEKRMKRIALELIQLNANPLIRNNDQLSPQESACQGKLVFLLETLITHRSHILPLLFFTVKNGLIKAFKELSAIYEQQFATQDEPLEKLYNSRDEFGATPFLVACELNQAEIVDFALQRDACPLTRDALGRNALEVALDCDAVETAKVIFKTISCPLSLSSDEELIHPKQPHFTALHMCVKNKKSTMAKKLLQFGYDLLAKDAHRNTPLHLAAKAQNTTISLCFIKHAYRLSLLNELMGSKNLSGKTPLDLFKSSKQTLVIDQLKRLDFFKKKRGGGY
ncbi:MAG: ankyrin repeat domain-containing protein [Parachlamydiaceae bacterium]